MTVSIWQANDAQPTRGVDFLVIGAGVVGCAAASFAARAGREVVITDQRTAGAGASGRNAGFMITGLDTYYHHAIETHGHAAVRELWTLSARTHDLWRGFAAAGDVPLDECGSLLLAESAEEAADLKQAAQVMQADGIDVIYYDRDPLGRGYHAALEQPWDCAVQPYQLTQAVLAQSGAEYIPGNEFYRLEQARPGCVRVYTRQTIFEARKVLLCTNAYSPHLDPYFVGKVTPTRAQCLVTEPLPEPVLPCCGYSDYGYMYYRMTFDGRLLVGGGRKTHKAEEDDTTEDRITENVQRTLEAYLAYHFPDVDSPVSRRWSGVMGFTPDKIPLVGTLPGKPDVGFAVGFTGHGLAFGAGAAERAVDHLLHGTHPGALAAERLD
jgi:gamma-glutamylputrescine oxidase